MNADHARLLPEYRLRRGEDFRRVYDRRCSAADAYLIVLGRENGLPYSRLGLSVSKKVGNAIVRNRWKRLIREAFRLSRAQLPAGVDFVVIPRFGRVANFSEVLESLPPLTHRVASKLRRGQSRSGTT